MRGLVWYDIYDGRRCFAQPRRITTEEDMSFRIIRSDITKVAADAIVNTANPLPVFGSGTDRAVYTAAGAGDLLAERRKIGRIGVGEAAATPGFALPAKYIIHTVGPAWEGGDRGEREAVRRCYDNSLALAAKLGCESVAFPLIATGTYGFPKDEALQIAVAAFSSFLASHEMEVILVVFDKESFVLSGRIFSGVDEFIDENYAAAAENAEYFSGLSKKEEIAPIGDFFASLFDEYDIDSKPARPARKRAPTPAASGGAKAKKRSLEEIIAQVDETWQESLLRLIDEKGYGDTEVYKRANIDRKLFSKIRSNRDYRPKKMTAVALALALRLSFDETKDFLMRAGYAFSPSSVSDLIIRYFIEEGVYDVYAINLALFSHGQPILGE